MDSLSFVALSRLTRSHDRARSLDRGLVGRTRARIQTPGLAPGPMPPGVNTDLPGNGVVPFVQASSPPRTAISVQTGAAALTGAQQPVTNVIPGSGYMLWVDNFVQIIVSGTGNSSGTTVAYGTTQVLGEDNPWSSLALITMDDGGPQNINLDGYACWLINLYGAGWAARDRSLSADVNVHSALSSGTGTAAGTGQFHALIPVAINERDYWGLMGNQDRATRYNLRTDIAGTGAIYSTAPSVLPTITISRSYGWLPVPSAQAADGRRQEVQPSHYGIIHYLTSVRSDALPAASSTVNHYIRNLANAVRLFILVFRSTSGSRATANTTLPSQIDVVFGTDPVLSESAVTRRRIMWDRYGFDAPSGVLVYDFVRDFGMLAGTELGNDYVYLGNLSEAQFRITYPAGWGAGSYLQIITDSLFIPPGINIY